MAFLFETRSMKISRVKRASASYPLYDPPHKKPKRRPQAEDNFDYFMRVRLGRLAFFQQWLRTNFDLTSSLDRDGVIAISQWADRYGCGLFGDEFDDPLFFRAYGRDWTGSYTGYNVIFDLGIFVGEFVIGKRPPTCWALAQTREAPQLVYQPRVEGMAPFNVAWAVLSERHRGIAALDFRVKAGKNELVRWIKQFMYLARTRERERLGFSRETIDKESLDLVQARSPDKSASRNRGRHVRSR
jgi:hypothetical protein